MRNLRITIHDKHIDISATDVDQTALDRLLSILCLVQKALEVADAQPAENTKLRVIPQTEKPP